MRYYFKVPVSIGDTTNGITFLMNIKWQLAKLIDTMKIKYPGILIPPVFDKFYAQLGEIFKGTAYLENIPRIYGSPINPATIGSIYNNSILSLIPEDRVYLEFLLQERGTPMERALHFGYKSVRKKDNLLRVLGRLNNDQVCKYISQNVLLPVTAGYLPPAMIFYFLCKLILHITIYDYLVDHDRVNFMDQLVIKHKDGMQFRLNGASIYPTAFGRGLYEVNNPNPIEYHASDIIDLVYTFPAKVAENMEMVIKFIYTSPRAQDILGGELFTKLKTYMCDLLYMGTTVSNYMDAESTLSGTSHRVRDFHVLNYPNSPYELSQERDIYVTGSQESWLRGTHAPAIEVTQYVKNATTEGSIFTEFTKMYDFLELITLCTETFMNFKDVITSENNTNTWDSYANNTVQVIPKLCGYATNAISTGDTLTLMNVKSGETSEVAQW